MNVVQTIACKKFGRYEHVRRMKEVRLPKILLHWLRKKDEREANKQRLSKILLKSI